MYSVPINKRTSEAEDSFKNQLSKLQSGGSSQVISPNSGNLPSRLLPLVVCFFFSILKF